MSDETRTDGFWSAEAREGSVTLLRCRGCGHLSRWGDPPCCVSPKGCDPVEYVDLDRLRPIVERMIEDERARAGQIMDRALADVQKASEDVQADLDAAASLARQAASDRARDCAAAEDVIRRRGIELGRLDAAGRKLAEAGDALALEVEKVEHRTDLTGAHRRWHECRAASPWGDER